MPSCSSSASVRRPKHRSRRTIRCIPPQEIQTEKPKLLRKALACSDPVAARALLARCGMDVDKVERGLPIEVS
jgi:hypothetical protein|tara:strand:- start:149 stop:367 length:219 start_codon:yes stop_codon:yes gene_type:complete